jgi:hypothetical protein
MTTDDFARVAIDIGGNCPEALELMYQEIDELNKNPDFEVFLMQCVVSGDLPRIQSAMAIIAGTK